MRFVSILLLLAICCDCDAQTTYQLTDQKPSAQDVAKATSVLDAVKAQAPVSVGIGGYALIQIKVTTKLTTYLVPGSTDCLVTETIPKGQPKKGWCVPAGSKEWQYVTIAPDPDFDRLWVSGTIKGSATILWMAVVNGEAVVVAGYQFDVAGGKPKPVDPIDPIPDNPVNPTDPLVIAATADIKAGKGTADDVSNYATIYSMYSSQVKNGTTLVTVGDLYKEMNASIDRLLGEDIEKCFPTLRKAVGAELRGKIPTNAATKIADCKAAVSAEFLDISKRLAGVK